MRLLSVVGERSWGRRSPPLQQLPSPSLGGRTGRLGANLLHSTTERRWRAQFHRVCKAARPPSVPGCARLRPLAPGCARLRPVAPGCARLRPVVPSSAVPHHPAPSRTVAPGPFRGAAPSHSKPLRTPAPSHPSAIAPRPLHTPVPSRSSAIAPRPFALLHRHTPALRVTSSIVATAFPDGISLESPLSYSLTVFAEIAGNRPPANLS
ncbi:hypothetical protein AEQU_1291 [Adlercreutzia equolifaciens DSM 19450]|nr:hypothetical protein AEQU_1291 [Adlercreutzia equolifaciens DSM 19450]